MSMTAVKAASAAVTADSTAAGIVTVADATPFSIGAYAFLNGTGLPTITVKIVSLPAVGKIGVRLVPDPRPTDNPFPLPLPTPNYGFSNVSAYTLAAGSKISQSSQYVDPTGAAEPVPTSY